MSKLYAYSATAAGIARRLQERGVPDPVIEPVAPEPAPVVAPVADNVVKLVIPRTEAQQIIADIAHKHGLTYADLLGRDRFRHFVAARHEAVVAVSIAKPHLSLVQLGRLFRRDYSTIFHALSKARSGASS